MEQGLISQQVLMQAEAPGASTPLVAPHLPQDELLVCCVSPSSPHQEDEVQPILGQELSGALSWHSQGSLSCSSLSLAWGISLVPNTPPWQLPLSCFQREDEQPQPSSFPMPEGQVCVTCSGDEFCRHSSNFCTNPPSCSTWK